MSYEIEYNHQAILVDMEAGFAAQQKLAPGRVGVDPNEAWYYQGKSHLVLVEEGSSNCYDEKGNRARSWRLGPRGRDVLIQVIKVSDAAEREMVRLKGRCLSAEAYIKHYRKLLNDAAPLDASLVPTLEFVLDAEYEEPAGDASASWRRRAMMEDPFTSWLMENGQLGMRELREFGSAVNSLVLKLGGVYPPTVTLASLVWLLRHASGRGVGNQPYIYESRPVYPSSWQIRDLAEAHARGQQLGLLAAA